MVVYCAVVTEVVSFVEEDEDVSSHMHIVAIVNAALAMDNAPAIPSFWMLKNTDTTIKFKGMPNKFMSTDR